ncbi:exodeoxyribonuclease V subunit beta [bacterium]|nr:exodeoxyribonuclease V subunit beta [bacterium]
MTSFEPLDILSIPLSGTNLIEASAGTGKTYTITNLYLRFLLELKMEVKNILVVTFTEAATKELIDRIRKNLNLALMEVENAGSGDDGTLKGIVSQATTNQSTDTVRSLLRKAIVSFDEASIYTIHGFCRKLLNDYSFETSVLFDTELISDQELLIQEITDDFWRMTFSKEPPQLTEIALNNNLDTKGFLDFAHQYMRTPFIRTIPETVENPFTALTDCIQSIKEEWRNAGEEIKEILITDTGLKREKKGFKPDVLYSFYERMDQLAEDKEFGRALEIIQKFSAGTLLKSMKKDKTPPIHRFFDLCQECTGYEQEVITWLKYSFLRFLKFELRRRKQASNVQSFDDLLSLVRDALNSKDKGQILAASIRNTYKAALVDEFQDTDPVQYDIFKTIFSQHCPLFYIGDPKQSIYSFRGADLFSYIKAAKGVKAEHRFTLDKNWRSEQGFVTAVNRIFSKPTNPFVLGDSISFFQTLASENSKGNQNPLQMKGTPTANLILWFLKKENPTTRSQFLNKEEARQLAVDAVVYEISRLLSCTESGEVSLGEKKLTPADFAILVLRNNDAQEFKDRLGRLGIPAVITKSGDVFKTDEAKELYLLLQAVVSPLNSTKLNSALASNLIGLTASEIQTLLEDESRIDDYEHHIIRFTEYHDLWKSKGFIRMFRKFLTDYGVRRQLIGLTNGERRLTNVLHLSELIHAETLKNKRGINGIITWLNKQIQLQEVLEEKELRLERDGAAVQISTVFKSKGLQYPIVFCPFMWQRGITNKKGDPVFHHDDDLFWHIGPDSDKDEAWQQSQKEMLADLIRLLYVAITRAQNRCYLVCGKIGKTFDNSLDYIFSGGEPTRSFNINQFIAKGSSFDEASYQQIVEELMTEDDSSIDLHTPVIGESIRYRSDAETNAADFKPRVFTGTSLFRQWGIASYSKLVAGKGYAAVPEEEAALLSDEIPDFTPPEGEADSDSFFSFPGGRIAGSCIHSVFEKLDFTLNNQVEAETMIQNELIRYGLANREEPKDNRQKMVDSVYKMVTRVLEAPLSTGKSQFTLGNLLSTQKLVELEFYYPIKKLTPEILGKAFEAGDLNLADGGDIPDKIGNLTFRPIEGFMHGFVDLVFQCENRYYILDWKTNHLGPSYQNYTADNLSKAMVDSLYILQYYIYSVALHQYLKSRIPDYHYKTHFGGVFYLFVRGVHPEMTGNGVFFDCPPETVITKLCKIID